MTGAAMTGTAMTSAALDEPTITATEIGPGHDGRPEVVVTLVYANGASSQLSLDQEMVEQAIAGSDITDLTQLAGRPWSVLFASPGDPPLTEETSTCSTTCST
jgi:hypothetical protein